MLFIYNILVYITALFLKIVAYFNNKISLFVKGRKKVFEELGSKLRPDEKVIWIHTASLGEFEQGLPVMEEIKRSHPGHRIVLSFFSPSGYEVKKDTAAADVVVYLPLDTKANAKKFLDLIQPELAIFVKYEFWPNYLSELRKRDIRTLLISAIFRKDQAFFRPYGSLMRTSLQTFDHFFVQNTESQQLLKGIGFTNVTVSGDTRFDRVSSILQRDNELDFIEAFKQEKLCFVAGSTWPEDERLIVDFINNDNAKNVKYIIVPHDIKPAHFQNLKYAVTKKVILYSEMKNKDLSQYDVFIIDTIGLLTRIYSYADIAYVGGGMGSTGLHNTLEPAAFGIPVITGRNISKFREAIEMNTNGGLISVHDSVSFDSITLKLIENAGFRKELGLLNSSYINKNTGATNKICCHIDKLL